MGTESRVLAEGRRTRPVVLILLEHYIPGLKAGGPIRSIEHLVEALGGEYRFRILTTDRDLGDRKPYSGIRAFRWSKRGRAAVMYLTPGPRRFWTLIRLLRTGNFDVVYLNSFFGRFFSILPILLRRLGLIRRCPLVIAPRGEFSTGALAIKRGRKRAYLWLASRSEFFVGHDIVWQASTDREAQDIRAQLGSYPVSHALSENASVRGVGVHCAIAVATDLGARPGPPPTWLPNVAGGLRVVFLSRISRKKNLIGAIRILHELEGPVEFSIYGPIEDDRYWTACLREMKRLPGNVRAEYKGQVSHSQVAGVFASHDVFLFPTHGENYGHVILEALLAGCPVLTSDQTPWNDIGNYDAGWALPLRPEAAFTEALRRCGQMSEQELRRFRERAATFGRRRCDQAEYMAQHRDLFRLALETKARRK